MRTAVALIACVFLLAGTGAAGAGEAPPATTAQFFERRVRPVLAEHCHSCHGPTKQKSGLRLDSLPALLKGGAGGPVVRPGDPENSSLVHVLRHDGPTMMPP